MQHQPRGDPTAHADPGGQPSQTLHKNVSKNRRTESCGLRSHSSQKWTATVASSWERKVAVESSYKFCGITQANSIASLEDFSLPLPPKVHCATTNHEILDMQLGMRFVHHEYHAGQIFHQRPSGIALCRLQQQEVGPSKLYSSAIKVCWRQIAACPSIPRRESPWHPTLQAIPTAGTYISECAVACGYFPGVRSSCRQHGTVQG